MDKVISRFLFGEIGINQLGERGDRLFLVRAVGNKCDLRALDDAKGKHAEKALRIDASVFFLDPNAALEFIRLLDKESSRSGMEADLIVDNYLFGNHTCHSLTLYKMHIGAFLI